MIMDQEEYKKRLNAKQIGAKIKNERMSLGMTQREVAAKVKVAPSTIMRYEQGQILDVKIPVISSIAAALNVNPSWLLGYDVPKEREKSNVTPVRIGETVKIPVYGRIPAGSPSEAIEEIEDYIDVPAELAAKNDLLVLRVSGNSMYPKYIEGDYVIIKKQPDCESGQDCAVRVNGCDATLKKVIKERDGIMLQPINPEYAPKKYDYMDEFNPVSIIGVVIELRRKI